MAKAVAFTEAFGGYVETKSDSGETLARATFRVPVATFKETITKLEDSGEVLSRSVKGEDVTEDYVDVQARLANKIVLRDRIKSLLSKATGVKEILEIETELNRIQSDIDSMEARIRSMKGKIDYATVHLTLRRKPIPGPLGYLLNGILWGLEKLFVIRE